LQCKVESLSSINWMGYRDDEDFYGGLVTAGLDEGGVADP